MAAQTVFGLDAYDAVSSALAAASGITYSIRLLLRPRDEPRFRRGRPDELLVIAAVLALGVLLLHQLVTDGVCHGACLVPAHRPSVHR